MVRQCELMEKKNKNGLNFVQLCYNAETVNQPIFNLFSN